MEKITLPGTELNVSRVCIGCWQFNGGQCDLTWPAQSEQTSRAIVDKALELGVNFFDTAEGYGDHMSEKVLGKCLGNRRKDVVIGTKFGKYRDGKQVEYTAEDIDKALTASLQALQTDYIDLYQAHWMVNCKNVKETVTELKRQQAKGRIRAYGVCNFGPKDITDVYDNEGSICTNQVPYNLLWRAIEYEIIPECLKRNIGVLAYSPLQQGLLCGQFTKPEDVPEGRRRTRHFSKDSTKHSRHGQKGAEAETFKTIDSIRDICKDASVSMPAASLSWLLAQQGISAVIVGARSPEQVEDNCKIVQLSTDTVMKLDECTEDLKDVFGSNPDMWSPVSRYH
ncbi:putative oxidoreductase YccK [Glandiceps talaboti]